jgi:xylulokinase
LICFKNGSLARERLRDQYGIDWDKFNQFLESTKSNSDGGILLPWYEAEIVPRVNKPGIHRFDLDPNDAAANCRAFVEGQMMSMRLHSEWMNVKPKKILATGGGSVNVPILQIMADVMNCPVYRIEVSKSAALGAALRAAQGWLTHEGKAPTWDKIVRGYTDPTPGSEIKPSLKAAKVYDNLIEKYAKCEKQALATNS